MVLHMLWRYFNMQEQRRKQKRIIVKNVHQHHNVRNVQQDIIQLMEFAQNAANKDVQIHVMFQKVHVKYV